MSEPFIDTDDIADVATKALTEDGHAGLVHEITGPRLLTFAEAAAEISAALGRPVRYLPVSAAEFAPASSRPMWGRSSRGRRARCWTAATNR
ncbi:hypothetical protein [Amycolatopsis methanolica]|uniref:NmrA family protein n=1 Tax=Amycolatopsis methanolica 239 TaxID=1068978 RepID=A0A076N0R5_AMYME|nr:hypothetical protein [Amycolatopsis methanolica]AIJ24455.1 NmrA family protein [Amycolatopsis methanolica 239]